MPAPYATEQEVKDFYAGESAHPLKVSVARSTAARIVARHAPAPPVGVAGLEDAVYAGLARNAELMIGEYLWSTKGFVKNVSVSSISEAYGDSSGVLAIVGDVMGDYLRVGVGENLPGSSYTLDVQSTFPSVDPFDLPTP